MWMNGGGMSDGWVALYPLHMVSTAMSNPAWEHSVDLYVSIFEVHDVCCFRTLKCWSIYLVDVYTNVALGKISYTLPSAG